MKPSQLPQMSLHCPTCGEPARVRTSRPLSETTRELYLECTNPKCRTVFQGLVEATKIIGPSLLPAAEQSEASLSMRRGLRARRAVRPAEDPRQSNLILHPPDT